MRGSRQLGVALSLVLFAAVACGGETGTDTGAGTTVASEATSASAPPAVTMEDAPDTTEPNSGSADQDDAGSAGSQFAPVMEGGAATLTVAEETVEFDFFVCFFGDPAAEFSGDDDATFFALGQGQNDSGDDVTVAVAEVDKGFGPNYTIFYSRDSSEGKLSWQLVGFEAAQIDGDQVAGEGDFSRIVDNQLRDETDAGSLDGTCSPNSIGSSG